MSTKPVTVDGAQTTEYVTASSATNSSARDLDVGVLLGGTCYKITAAYRPDVDPSPPALDVLEAVLLSFEPSV